MGSYSKAQLPNSEGIGAVFIGLRCTLRTSVLYITGVSEHRLILYLADLRYMIFDIILLQGPCKGPFFESTLTTSASSATLSYYSRENVVMNIPCTNAVCSSIVLASVSILSHSPNILASMYTEYRDDYYLIHFLTPNECVLASDPSWTGVLTDKFQLLLYSWYSDSDICGILIS